jgi:hypothetical protein
MWHWGKKTTVEECRSLKASNFRKWGVFKIAIESASGSVQWTNSAGEVRSSIGYSFSRHPTARLTLRYTISRNAPEEEKHLDYDISLMTTPCNYGGYRFWFLCPLSKNGYSCNRRAATLFLPPGGLYFGCRKCYDLTYASCQEHDARVDRLAKNPEILEILLKNPSLSTSLLVFKACDKLLKKRRLFP